MLKQPNKETKKQLIKMANIEVIYTIKNKSIREKVNRDLQ